MDPASDDNKDTWDAISGALVKNLKNTIEVNKDFLPHTHENYEKLKLQIEDLNDKNSIDESLLKDLVAYWSAEEIPDVPDDTSGQIYRWNKTSIDGWISDYSPAAAIVNGTIVATGDLYQSIPAAPANSQFVVKVSLNKSTRMHVVSGNPNSSIQVEAKTYDAVANTPFTACCTLCEGAVFIAIGTPLDRSTTITLIEAYVGPGTYSTPLLDNSGRGHHGKIYACSPLVSEGKKALSFNGITSKCDLGQIPIGDALTVSLWIKSNNYAVTAGLFNKGVSMGGSQTYSMDIYEDGRVLWEAFVSGSRTYQTYNLVAGGHNGRWVHLVGTYDNSKLRLYVNGSQATAADPSVLTGALYPVSYNVWLGCRYGDNSYFSGLIADPCIFNRALSEDEVQRLYQKSSLQKRMSSNTLAVKTLRIENADHQGFDITYTTSSLDFNYKG